MRNLGIALVIVDIVALVVGLFGYNKQSTILDVGGLKATATEHRSVPWAPVAGAIAMVGGVMLMVVPKSH